MESAHFYGGATPFCRRDTKVADFQTALHKKQAAQDYNFRGVWFPKGFSFKELPGVNIINPLSVVSDEYIDFSVSCQSSL